MSPWADASSAPSEPGYRRADWLAPAGGGAWRRLSGQAFSLRTASREAVYSLVARLLAAGFQAHLRKPVESDEIIAAVASLAVISSR